MKPTRFSYKGKRIRAGDKHLIFRLGLMCLTPMFFFVLLAFHLPHLQAVKWAQVGIPNIGETVLSGIDTVYLAISIAVSLLVCAGLGALYFKCFPQHYKQLEHRQAIAQMVVSNGWCDTSDGKSDSWFQDLGQSGKKRIVRFPQVWYFMRKGVIHLTVKISMDKHQKQLADLESKIEPGLFCETISKSYHDGYLSYGFLYNAALARIGIADVTVTDGAMKLMHHISWRFDSLPHMLIAGGTGGGKTYFLLTIIQALVRANAVLYVLDPKNADLADLAAVMPSVYHKKEDMIDCLNQFYEDMMAQSAAMKALPNYLPGQNYAYYGLPAHFLIFDEYVAFMEMVGMRESGPVMDKIKQIIMLGRQSGFFLILACQRPDAKYLQDGARDQFNFRVALGRLSEHGYSMMFGDVRKEFLPKDSKGRGYVDVGENVITEFYTPLVPAGYEFLREIGRYTAVPEDGGDVP